MMSLLIRSLYIAPLSDTAVMSEVFEDSQELSEFIHLWHCFDKVVLKSVFGSDSTEICLPIYSVQWLVSTVGRNFKYVYATLYILAQS